jgi:hypothetical protein
MAEFGDWDDVVVECLEPEFERVEFNDPLCVLFSSGNCRRGQKSFNDDL